MNAVSDEGQLSLLLQGIDIPPCPAILMDIDRELRKETVDQREIARLVARDVGLSGQLMQLANSPALNGGRQFTSVIQALNVLGTQQVLNLVISQLLKVAMEEGQSVSLERFWDSSAQTARVSAEIARRLRCMRPDVAYTFGLFHDCGIPLIMKRFPQAKSVLALANGEEFHNFSAVEEAHLGTSHAIVGYFLAKRWNLPDFVAEAILHHHDYVVFEDKRCSEPVRNAIAVCVLAEHVIRLQHGGLADMEWVKAAPGAASQLGISLVEVDDLIEDLLDWLH